MIITFHGEGCFKIQTTKAVVTNGRLKADIFVRTAPDGDNKAQHNIKGPGEYEVQGVEIRGFPSFVYWFKADDINCGYFKEVTSDVTEKLMGLDILFAPASQETAKAIRQLHPKIAVVTGGKSQDLEKDLGLKVEKLDKLTVKKKDFAVAIEKPRLIELKA